MKDINLLYEEDKKVPQVEVSEAKPVKTVGKVTLAVLIAAIAATTIIAPVLFYKAMNLKLTSIQDQLKSEKYQEVVSVKSQLAAAEQQLNDKMNIIACIDEQAYPVNDILNAVRNNTPEGCMINDIQYDTNKLRLGVKARGISNIAEFLLNMDRLKNIRLSENSNTIKINTSGDYVFNFDVGEKDGE